MSAYFSHTYAILKAVKEVERVSCMAAFIPTLFRSPEVTAALKRNGNGSYMSVVKVYKGIIKDNVRKKSISFLEMMCYNKATDKSELYARNPAFGVFSSCNRHSDKSPAGTEAGGRRILHDVCQ